MQKSTFEIFPLSNIVVSFLQGVLQVSGPFLKEIHISLLPQNVLQWEAAGVPLDRSLKTAWLTMQLMLATCNTYLLPFWLNHPPALPDHTSTSSSPMAGKAFTYSPDSQSRIIANCSSKASLSKSAIIKTVPGQLGWIGTIGIPFWGGFNYEGTFTDRGAVLNWRMER